MKKLLSWILCLGLILSLLPMAASAADVIDFVFADIAAPAIGEKPSYDAQHGGLGWYLDSAGNNPNYYKNGVGWYDLTDGKNLRTTDSFVAGHEYKVMVFFVAEEGFIFHEGIEIQINGEDAVVTKLSDTMVIGELSFSELTDPNPFTDVKESDYYYEPVLWAVENKVTTGTSETTFSPNDPCTRAQVVTFLWRSAGNPEPSSTDNPFKDVAESTYYYKAVLWAVEEGITNGTSETTFSPDAPCTRAQVVTFLWRADGATAPEKSDNPFKDIAAGEYYYNAVLWAVEKKITTGTSDTTFSPDETCIRAQIVTFLYRYMMGKAEELSIRFQPEDYHMQSSMETADFLIQVSGGVAPYTFTWIVYYDDVVVELEPVTFDSPIHVLSREFSDYDFDEYDNISVSCDVEDADGNLVNSDLAWVYPYFAIASQPEDYQMTSSAETAGFTVVIAGNSGPYTYQWVVCYDNEEVFVTPTTGIFSSNTLAYDFSDYDFDDYHNIGVYCIITNSYGVELISDLAEVFPKS